MINVSIVSMLLSYVKECRKEQRKVSKVYLTEKQYAELLIECKYVSIDCNRIFGMEIVIIESM